MNIHEYQAKEILKSFSVKIQNGHVVSSPSEALKSAKKMQKNQKRSPSNYHIFLYISVWGLALGLLFVCLLIVCCYFLGIK